MPNGNLLLGRGFARGAAPDVPRVPGRCGDARLMPNGNLLLGRGFARGAAPDVPAFLDVLDVAAPGAAGAPA